MNISTKGLIKLALLEGTDTEALKAFGRDNKYLLGGLGLGAGALALNGMTRGRRPGMFGTLGTLGLLGGGGYLMDRMGGPQGIAQAMQARNNLKGIFPEGGMGSMFDQYKLWSTLSGAQRKALAAAKSPSALAGFAANNPRAALDAGKDTVGNAVGVGIDKIKKTVTGNGIKQDLNDMLTSNGIDSSKLPKDLLNDLQNWAKETHPSVKKYIDPPAVDPITVPEPPVDAVPPPPPPPPPPPQPQLDPASSIPTYEPPDTSL